MPLQTGSADLSHFDEDEPTVEKATLDAHITEVISCQYCLRLIYGFTEVKKSLYYILEPIAVTG